MVQEGRHGFHVFHGGATVTALEESSSHARRGWSSWQTLSSNPGRSDRRFANFAQLASPLNATISGVGTVDQSTRPVGALTIKGVTCGVALAVVPNGRTLEPWGKQRVAFSARASIDRRDFGFTGNLALAMGGFVIGERIDVEIEVEAMKQPATRAA